MKKTEVEKFAYQLNKPDSKLIKLIDYLTHNDIYGKWKAVEFGSTSKRVMKAVGTNNLITIANLMKRINRYMKSIKVISERYNGTRKVYFIPTSFDKTNFDKEKENLIRYHSEVKRKVDKYIEDKKIIKPKLLLANTSTNRGKKE